MKKWMLVTIVVFFLMGLGILPEAKRMPFQFSQSMDCKVISLKEQISPCLRKWREAAADTSTRTESRWTRSSY
ncbi:hypothetical protein [Bacillus pumilus]|uniref:hypothetical protein n=1 Tax=Bacillus pumilus TaxID=1408 RepID=UPI0021B1FA65|nr:hypothetical protein [Bacillus pumilus]